MLCISAIGAPGDVLFIYNISRYCDGIYECVASNGVQEAVSKEIQVEVQCMSKFYKNISK